MIPGTNFFYKYTASGKRKSTHVQLIATKLIFM